MGAYIVDRAEETADHYWTKGENPRELRVLKVWIRDGDGQAPTECEWHTIMATTLPQPGSILEGNIEFDRSKGVYKFRKAKNVNAGSPGGGGGNSGYNSPESVAERASTGRAQGRAHAQHMAILYAQAKAGHSDGILSEGFDRDTHLKQLIDWFFNDAQAAKDKAA